MRRAGGAEADLVLRELAARHPEVAGAITDIAPGDAMYGFALRACRDVASPARLEYFASAAAAYRLTAQALAAVPVDAPVLDFGCGHGRVGRLLVRALGPRLWATEADTDGVDFVRSVLGIQAFPSPLDPADFATPSGAPERFGLVLAYSVLSHLPRPRFVEWLRRWLALLQPGGLLVASVLPDDTLLPGRTLPADGFHFEAMSESRALDLDDYGTAWVTEAFVARALHEASQGRTTYRRVPRGLWHLQDVYLVAVDDAGEQALAQLTDNPDTLDPGPAGRLERVDLGNTNENEPDRLQLSGWAVAGRGQRPATIELTLEPPLGHPDPRVTRSVDTSAPRPDAATLLGVPAAAPLGFTIEIPGPVDPRTTLRLLVRDPVTGASHPLWLGPVDSAALTTALHRTADERDTARDALAIVEASGFGRLRRRWMEWKRRLGR